MEKIEMFPLLVKFIEISRSLKYPQVSINKSRTHCSEEIFQGIEAPNSCLC